MFDISKAVTLFHIGEVEKSRKLFDEFHKNTNFADIPFDVKDYVELWFYLLGKKLYTNQRVYSKRFKEKIKETNYRYFDKF